MVAVSEIQQDIIDEVGDTDPPTLTLRIDRLWARFADKAATFPRLQELYTKRACIDILLAKIRNEVNFSHDGSILLSLDQRTSHLSDRRKETQAEIARLETIGRANRPAVVAPLVSTEIEPPPIAFTPPPVAPDANSEVYRGSPYFRTGGPSQ